MNIRCLLLLIFLLQTNLVIASCQNFFQGPEDFFELDWRNKKGWFSTYQKPILTDLQIQRTRETLQKFTGHDYSYGNVLENLESFSKTTKRHFGNNIEKRITQYLKEVELLIKKGTDDPFAMDIFIRDENFSSKQIQNGHSHAKDTLTITKSELGPSSWIMVNGTQFQLYNISNALVFTDEFHGMPVQGMERLVFIIFVRFDRQNERINNDFNRPMLKPKPRKRVLK